MKRPKTPLWLGLLFFSLLHGGGLFAKSVAWDERNAWPTVAQATVLPRAAKVMGVLLGNELAADLMWIRSLIYAGSSIEETGAYDQLDQYIEAILDLDPKFRRVYKWACYEIMYRNETSTQEEAALSVKYIERAVKEFPDSYELFWIGGLRYFLDLHPDDPKKKRQYRERGMELIELAMHKKDAPARIATLAASMRTQLGQRDRAISNLKQVLLNTEDETDRGKLARRLAHLAGQDVADAILAEVRRFEVAHTRALPMTPTSMYILLGDPPSATIDFDSLANSQRVFDAPLDPESSKETSTP